jgi:peptide/nickel transport system substrate-binding protein
MWVDAKTRCFAHVLSVTILLASSTLANAKSLTLIEPGSLVDQVTNATLPPITERVPAEPSVVRIEEPGRYGGSLRMLMGRAKDIRMMIVYGYARLVGYDRAYKLVPDILKSIEVKEGREFTLTLRKGHKWSDGHPFTTEDFRYYWEDVVRDETISPYGPPKALLVDGQSPRFEVLDDVTIRYTWSAPNPFFLSALAAASPLFIYRPAHYMKQFHAKYVDKAVLEEKIKSARKRNWRALHFSVDRQYRNDNPDLPTLQPWFNSTRPPSERFVFKRNPYYHRVDERGRQLPYIDRAIINVTGSSLIPAKTGSGESDLQARGLQFKNYTFLKGGEKRNGFKVRRWLTATGAQMALYPNLNASDLVWRTLLRKAEFRRALSLAINRHEINEVVFFGLGIEGNNTVLPKSPLFDPSFQQRWASFDIKRANALLDKIGLTKRDDDDIRLLPDGRPMEIVVETAGEDSDQADVLQLVADSWRQVGIKLFTKPTRREVLRRRTIAGATIMSVWFGMENGVPTELSSPEELAPTRDSQFHWPKWGLRYQASGKGGEPVDLAHAKRLLELNAQWGTSKDAAERTKIWNEMLEIHVDQMFTIGLISGVPQPVVVSNALHNVPISGVYGWDPGAHFGIYRPDTFWFDQP